MLIERLDTLPNAAFPIAEFSSPLARITAEVVLSRGVSTALHTGMFPRLSLITFACKIRPLLPSPCGRFRKPGKGSIFGVVVGDFTSECIFLYAKATDIPCNSL